MTKPIEPVEITNASSGDNEYQEPRPSGKRPFRQKNPGRPKGAKDKPITIRGRLLKNMLAALRGKPKSYWDEALQSAPTATLSILGRLLQAELDEHPTAEETIKVYASLDVDRVGEPDPQYDTLRAEIQRLKAELNKAKEGAGHTPVEPKTTPGTAEGAGVLELVKQSPALRRELAKRASQLAESVLRERQAAETLLNMDEDDPRYRRVWHGLE
jgi:hypothetical protein